MIPRRLLTTLVFALPVFVVSFGVLMGAAELAAGLGDAAGERGLFWMAMAALILLLIDAVLLLGLLGVRALDEPQEPDGDA